MTIIQPTLVVDEEQCKANIAQMAKKARGLKFRPHFKTHQSLAIGEWFKEVGVKAITVSSIEMAQYFAADGWEEITIAFPVNVLRLAEINDLAESITLNVLVDNPQTVRKLAKGCDASINCYIELECGSGRTGIKYTDVSLISEVAEAIKEINHLKLLGCYTHSGHTYQAHGIEDINRIARRAKANFLTVKEFLDDDNLEFCWGDTPSCSVWDDFEGLDAISPGNFVFYDLMQYQIGSCSSNEIAVVMHCPVVSKKAGELEVCIHGGAVHFAKDYNNEEGAGKSFGALINNEDGTIEEAAYLKALSQEHGILQVNHKLFEQIQIGDVLMIYPIHSCLTAQCMGAYITTSGKSLDHFACA